MSVSPAQWSQIHYQKLKNMNFAICCVSSTVRHIHSCMELGIVLSGQVKVSAANTTYTAQAGKVLLFNSYEEHVLEPLPQVQILFLQLAPDFGKVYFAKVSRLEFDAHPLDEEIAQQIKAPILAAAETFFREPEAFGMECASLVTRVMTILLRNVPYRTSSDAEHMGKKKRVGRQQRIAAYVEEHIREKLTLSQLAKSEGITTAYMSHIFAELFETSFQDYLSHLRLQSAVPLLKKSNIYMVDICMECGFSDTRYLNAVCQKEYGCTATELRKKMQDINWQDPHEEFPKEELTYDDAASLQILQDFLNR